MQDGTLGTNPDAVYIQQMQIESVAEVFSVSDFDGEHLDADHGYDAVSAAEIESVRSVFANEPTVRGVITRGANDGSYAYWVR